MYKLICVSCGDIFESNSARKYCSACIEKRAQRIAPGTRFGKLVVIETEYKNNGKQNNLYVRVKCDCGNEKLINAQNLLRGRTKSCGCIRNEPYNGSRKSVSIKRVIIREAIVEYASNNKYFTYRYLAEKFGTSYQTVSKTLKDNGFIHKRPKVGDVLKEISSNT